MRNQLRAVLVTLHLLAVLLMSIPAPAGMNEATLKDENLQANFRDWAATAQGLGVQLTAADIEDLSRTWGSRVLGVRTTALAPFRPYYKYLGTKQRWQMFGYLNRRPGRIEVATCDPPSPGESERTVPLGIQTRQKKLSKSNQGFEITAVERNSPAHWGGLRKGDVLTHVDGQALRSSSASSVESLLEGPHRERIRVRLIRPHEGSSKSKIVPLYLCEDADWNRRFIMGSDEATWLRSQIEQERFRAIVSSFAWKRGETHYSRLGHWLSLRAAVDFPDAQVLAVRMVTLEIPRPAELRSLETVPLGETYWERQWPLSRETP